MSRYGVDKLMREAIQSVDAAAAFKADPAAYATGRELTAEERSALVAGDYGTLYRLGAHPFLLWAFTRAVLPNGGPPPEEYAATLQAQGTPDFAT